MDIQRITTGMMTNTLLSNLRVNLQQLEKYHYQLSSAKRLRYPSEDPIGNAKAMRFKTYLAQNEQYERNIDDAISWMQATDDALAQLDEKLRRARVLGVQGATETMNEGDREKIAIEVNALLEEIVEIANRKHNGKYIFSGTDTSTIPFVVERDADGYIINVKYQGDTNPIYREVDEGVLIQINTIGDDLFTAIPQKVKMGYDGVDNPTLPLAKYLTERPYTTGVFRINEKEIFYDITKDSLEDIRDKINGAKCGVTATIERDPGPPDVPAPYRLVLEANDPCARAAIWMEDLWERADPLLNDLMFVDPDNPNPPNNIHPGAEVLTNPDSLPTYEEKPHYFFFNALINLREALRDNDSLEIQDGITEIDFSIENKLVHRARIGATINRMENIRTRLRSRRLNTQELLSKIEDADMTDVIMRLRMQETIHQAALASGARLIHPTLMDFL